MGLSIDREKVIEGLRELHGSKETMKLISDTIKLLKEQEAIPVDTKVIGTSHGDMEVYCCSDYRTILDPAFHYCPNCGQAVEWG